MIKQSHELSLLIKGEFNKIKRGSNQHQKIILQDKLLEKVKETREIINYIKKEKDKLIKKYISNTKPPKILGIHKLTYKALLMYFRDTFINNKIELDFCIYKKDNKLDNSKLEEIFYPYYKIPLKVYLTNFPHLIGIKKNFLGSSNKVIEYILYDYELIDDFLKDGSQTDKEKLETFSWIKKTLYTPSYIINKNSINAQNFTSDLVFIKKILYPDDFTQRRIYSYHIVGLDYIKHHKERYFVIKSQFPVKSKKTLLKKFDLNNEENILFKYKKVK